MKTVKSRLLLLITAAIMAVCLCVGLTACGGGTDPFSAPENVTLNGNTLSWDEVEGAENGYTVKINEDETTKVTATSLDLTTVTAKLKEGANSLAVKVNAAGEKPASAYSEAKTYTYNGGGSQITTLAKPAGLKAEGGIVSWNAVANATSYVVTCNGHTETVTETKVSTSLFNLTEGATVTFSVKAKKDDIESEAATVNYTVPNPVQEAKDAIAAVKASLTDDNEATVKAVDDFEKIYNAYSATVKADADVIAAYAELTNARGEAKAAIEGEVDELKTAVDALLATEVKDFTAEKYASLAEKKTEINALGAYAKTYYDGYAAKIDELTAKETAVKTTAVNVVDDLEVFVNGANGNVNILYKAENVLGETLTGAAPALTVTLDAGAEVNTSSAAFSGSNGIYKYTVNFVKKGGDAATAAGYELKVTYKIGDGEEKTVTYAAIADDIYFNEPYNAIDSDDKIQYSGAPGDAAYLDIYETSAISIGAEKTSDPTISNFPLVKAVPVTNGMPVEELRSNLARDEKYGKILLDNTYEVRFVVYRMSVNATSGAISISNIKNSLVSHDTYTLNLTAEDTKERIDLGYAGTVLGTDGGITIGAAYSADVLAAQFNDAAVTAANVHEQLEYVIGVTLSGVTHSFTIPCPQGGSISSSVMQANIVNLFGETCLGTHAYTITLQLRLIENSKYSKTLRESVIRTCVSNVGDHKEVSIILPHTYSQVRFNGAGNALEFLREPSGGAVFNFDVQYVELKIEKGGNSYIAYFYNENGTAALYNDDKTVRKECNPIGDSYMFNDAFNSFMTEGYGLASFDVTDAWELSTRVVYGSTLTITTNYSTPITHNA